MEGRENMNMMDSHLFNLIKPPPPKKKQKKNKKKTNSNTFMYTHNLVKHLCIPTIRLTCLVTWVLGFFLDNLPMTNRCMRHDLNESMARCYLALGKTLEALDLTQNLVSTSMSNIDEFNGIRQLVWQLFSPTAQYSNSLIMFCSCRSIQAQIQIKQHKLVFCYNRYIKNNAI